ncbi:hypothetical protein OSB04_018915 [Centaurea solstitialis]|uniref:Uncharacterized protein n=1 Tax=Centaurea solstitialis TaxID=347529 RepID=A0AA38T7R4_9ASTR|nr:hypothetical protein OSB04_018915 [Centaurea solstitialis]
MYLASNPVQHQRTKHVEIDLHFVRERVAIGHVRILHVPSAYQYADIFTRGLPTIREVRLAFFAPIGGGPPSARSGLTLSNPLPMDANKKYSASRYSRFRGNSVRSLSLAGKMGLEFTVVKVNRKIRYALMIMRPMVDDDDNMVVAKNLQLSIVNGLLQIWAVSIKVRLSNVNDYK